MPFPRTKKRPLHEYRAILRVDVDFDSTGIWEVPEPCFRYAGKCVSYSSLGLPEWLIERFDYWTSWFNAHEPWRDTPGLDGELFRAYAFSLAADLKRVLGDDYYIEYGDREIHDDRDFLKAFHGHTVA